MTKGWPCLIADSSAIMLSFHHLQGRHALIYDMNTAHETFEWVDLKEVRLMFYIMFLNNHISQRSSMMAATWVAVYMICLGT